MSFTYDINRITQRDKLRILLGDTVEATAAFQDQELDVFLAMQDADLIERELLLLAGADALTALAARVASGANSGLGLNFRLGDYSVSGAGQVTALQDMAAKFRSAVNDAPAWGIAEQNLSSANEVEILRNYALRTGF